MEAGTYARKTRLGKQQDEEGDDHNGRNPPDNRQVSTPIISGEVRCKDPGACSKCRDLRDNIEEKGCKYCRCDVSSAQDKLHKRNLDVIPHYGNHYVRHEQTHEEICDDQENVSKILDHSTIPSMSRNDLRHPGAWSGGEELVFYKSLDRASDVRHLLELVHCYAKFLSKKLNF